MDLTLTTILSAIVLVIALYRWATRNNGYFLCKPIPSMIVKPIFGNTSPLVFKKRSFPDFVKDIYDQFRGCRVFGMFEFGSPIYVLRDPQLIKQIGVKDFDHFTDRRPTFGISQDRDNPSMVFQRMLPVLNGRKWRNMRATLLPVFTLSKLRQMFKLVVESSESMVRFCLEETCSKGKEYETKDLFGRFTTDVIALCAFGLKQDSFRQCDKLFQLGMKIMQFSRLSTVARMVGYRVVPALMDRLGIGMLDREHNDYFTKLIKGIVQTRKEQGIVRPDLVNLLMDAMKKPLEQENNEQPEVSTQHTISELDMIAQCLVFFLGNGAMVVNSLVFMAYELSRNPHVQTKLYEEIMETHASLQGTPLTYDALNHMKYLDMVLHETLRMWPPVAALNRVCVRDYQLQIGEGQSITIEKGIGVWFPVYALHHDPAYFPDPEKFIPERFSEENRSRIDPGAYLPFGIGPRYCIATGFAMMQIKTIMYHLLAKFSFERTPKTAEMPLGLAKGFIALTVKDGMFVEFRPRSVSDKT